MLVSSLNDFSFLLRFILSVVAAVLSLLPHRCISGSLVIYLRNFRFHHSHAN